MWSKMAVWLHKTGGHARQRQWKGPGYVRLSIHLYGLYEYIWLDVTYTCFSARTDTYALVAVCT